METNQSIEKSRQIYAVLISLYPREHHDEYGADMLQLFTDQYREVKNRQGLVGFWLRTLVDLCINVLREQLSGPNRAAGLLEAPPNAPLPWKGVALVLVPGLIFFISQVLQLTGMQLFYLMVYRAAFFLILPVLVVWAWKRKFPIWGLIPLGLLVRTMMTLGRDIQYIWADRWKQFHDTLRSANRALDLPAISFETVRVVIYSGIALACIVLLWWVLRRVGVPRRAWLWMLGYILLVAGTIGLRVWHTLAVNDELNNAAGLYRIYLTDYSFEYLVRYGGFLVLILFGALLARQHGQLAMLLPLGFLLPTVLVGPMMDAWPSVSSPDFTAMLLIGASVLIYRFLVALAGPLWIVRSANASLQKRSSAVSLIILVVLQAACNVGMYFYYYHSVSQASYIFLAISEQLIIGSGIAAALSLYRPLSVAWNPQVGRPSAQGAGG